MVKNIFDLQKRFSNLLKVGDEMQVYVIPSQNEEICHVKTIGGVFGTMMSGWSFPQGTVLKVRICELVDNLPVFAPTEEWKLEKLPQEARICFITPRAIVVELLDKPGAYACYQPLHGLTEAETQLTENQKVMVRGLSYDAAKDYYLASYLESVADEPEPEETNPLLPWTPKQIEEAVYMGSRKMYGRAKLGKIFLVDVINAIAVQFPDGTKGILREGNFPVDIAKAFVRVEYISQNNEVTVRFVGKDKTSPVTTAVSSLKPEDCGYCDETLRLEALNNGSKSVAGPYKLGYNYKVKMKGGLPLFEPTREISKYPVNSVSIANVVELCHDYEDAEEVICRVDYINHVGVGNFIFNVTIIRAS